MKVSWQDEGVIPVKPLYFDDLSVGESFRIDTVNSKGAVYRKVDLTAYLKDEDIDEVYGVDNTCAMEEIATGKVFTPTKSPIKRVDVDVTIRQAKPDLYDNDNQPKPYKRVPTYMNDYGDPELPF
jgi:RecJ-like exonuclease